MWGNLLFGYFTNLSTSLSLSPKPKDMTKIFPANERTSKKGYVLFFFFA